MTILLHYPGFEDSAPFSIEASGPTVLSCLGTLDAQLAPVFGAQNGMAYMLPPEVTLAAVVAALEDSGHYANRDPEAPELDFDLFLQGAAVAVA